MPKSDILLKVCQSLVTVVGFVFSFVAYSVAVRPQIQSKMSEYTLGFIEGGIVFFVFTALPLTSLYLLEREKRRTRRGK